MSSTEVGSASSPDASSSVITPADREQELSGNEPTNIPENRGTITNENESGAPTDGGRDGVDLQMLQQYMEKQLARSIKGGHINPALLAHAMKAVMECQKENAVDVEQKHKFLREVDESCVTIDQVDPSSPLVSAKRWEDLDLSPNLLKGIQGKNFLRPSKIQAAALPLIISRNENLIAQAHNGSGKTAAFALAMLSKVDESMLAPQALCLCPTRELAQQTAKVVESLAMFTNIRVFLAVPQQRMGSFPERNRIAEQIVVGTPGKTMELLKKKRFPENNCKMLILDEADELINFHNNMAPQVQQIRRFFPQKLQILLFSATFSEEVRCFAEKLIPHANKIAVKKEELTLQCISQHYIMCDPSRAKSPNVRTGSSMDRDAMFNAKVDVLCSLYASMTIGQSVIFVNSRKTAFSLALRMQEAGFAISLICGTQASGPEKMEVEMRDQIMNEFRKGETKVLICTDVLARGIDVPQVTLVINFDLPIHYRGRAPTQDSYGSQRNRNNFGGGRGGGNQSYGFGSWEDGEDNFRAQMNQGGGIEVNMETYIHRIGRTGRFGAKGVAINLIPQSDMNLIDQIKQFYLCQITPLADDPEEIEEMISKLRL